MAQGPPHRLLVEERRRRILDLVRTRERLTVGELVKHFGVSPVTVRGDLDVLAANGEIVRSHGGGIKVRDAFPDLPLNVKETLHHAEKVRIGHAAAQLIREHEMVILFFSASMTYPGTCANRDRAKQLAPNEFVVVPVLREPDLGTHGV